MPSNRDDVLDDTVAASGVKDFDAVTTSLQASAIELLEELNAGDIEPDEIDEESDEPVGAAA